MARLLQSGKFWLKLIGVGGLSLLLILLMLHIALMEMFSADRIRLSFENALDDHSTAVHFNDDIDRSWFPRPTFTLHQFSIHQPNSLAPTVSVEKLRIGLAWESLFTDQLIIDKLQISDANIHLKQHPKGDWDLAYLFNSHSSQPPKINRLYLDNAAINIHLPEHEWHIRNLSLTALALNTPSPTLDFQADYPAKTSDGLSIRIKGNSVLQRQNNGWHLPEFTATVNTEWHGLPAHIQWRSSARASAYGTEWQFENISLQADLPYQAHLSAQSPLLAIDKQHTVIHELTGVLTSDYNEAQWNSTLSMGKIQLYPKLATIDKFSIAATHENSSSHTDLNLNGVLTWEHNHGLSSQGLSISTLHRPLLTPNQPLFQTQLQANFNIGTQNAILKATGNYDRQPFTLNLNASYLQENQPNTLSGSLDIEKLNLIPYLQHNNHDNWQFPAWLSHPNAPEIDTNIRINALQLPGLEAENIQTRLLADKQRIGLVALSAALYGGHIEGGLSIANTQPLSLHLQQIANKVNIKPFLQDLIGLHNISGSGSAVVDLTTNGHDRQTFTENLSGTLQLNVSDGIWNGIDIRNILQSASIDGTAGNIRKIETAFSRFNLNGQIENGILKHEHSEIISDSLIVRSNGRLNLNTQELSETLLIKNARNPKAKAIPLTVNGTFDNPAVTIDYPRLTLGLSTPEEKKQALSNMLKEQWQWLSPKNTSQ